MVSSTGDRLLTEGAVRAYVMGERGARNQPATPEDIEQMAAIVREGISAVILGRPNVGKSSLLNTLLEEDRAILEAFQRRWRPETAPDSSTDNASDER